MCRFGVLFSNFSLSCNIYSSKSQCNFGDTNFTYFKIIGAWQHFKITYKIFAAVPQESILWEQQVCIVWMFFVFVFLGDSCRTKIILKQY